MTEPDRGKRSSSSPTTSHGPDFRAGWTWRLTRWQWLQLEVAALLAALTALGGLGENAAASWVLVVVLAAASIPRPRLGRRQRCRNGLAAEIPTSTIWLNPTSASPPISAVDEVPTRYGERIAVADDVSGSWTMLDVGTDGGDDATPEDITRWFGELAGRAHAYISMQLVVIVRDLPVEMLAQAASDWPVDPDGLDPAALQTMRCSISLRVARGSEALGGADVRELHPDSARRALLRRAVLDLDQFADDRTVRFAPIRGGSLVAVCEHNSVGPEIVIDERAPDDPPPDEEHPSWWRFGDRLHTVYEIRRCTGRRLADLIRTAQETDTLAAAVSLRLDDASRSPHVPAVRRRVTALVRLTHVEATRLAAACEDIETAFDELGIRWHRLDGWHRSAFVASSIGGPALACRRPRLSPWSAVGPAVRSAVRRRRAEKSVRSRNSTADAGISSDSQRMESDHDHFDHSNEPRAELGAVSPSHR